MIEKPQQPEHEGDIENMYLEIGGIRDRVALLGANESEVGEINRIMGDFERKKEEGTLDAEEAQGLLAQAIRIKDSKNLYH